MARTPQTQAKRARELALKERRERKKAKKAEVAALRAAGIDPWAVEPDDALDDSPDGEAQEEEDGTASSREQTG